MTSGKQRRREIKSARTARARKKGPAPGAGISVTLGTAPCNPALLAPNHSCSDPSFVQCGYYRDLPFRCRDCGRREVWTATRQKWWYEVAKGDVWTTALRCNSCRRKERERRAEARRVHLEGVAAKASQRGEQVDR